MVWKDLLEHAVKLGYSHEKFGLIQVLSKNRFRFVNNGTVMYDENEISNCRSADQMYQIMLALEMEY